MLNDFGEEVENTIQVIVLGAVNTGKSTLIQKLIMGSKFQRIVSTVGIQFSYCKILIKSLKYTLNFWDTSGLSKYRKMIIPYFERAQAALIVYDVTNYSTYHAANEWINELYDNNCAIPIILFGNKTDLCLQQLKMFQTIRQVSSEEPKSIIKNIEAIHIQGCALTNNNLQSAFRNLISMYFLNNSIILEEHEISQDNCCCCL